MEQRQYVLLQDERRKHRRTIADALEVVRQEKLGLEEFAPGRVEVVPIFDTGIDLVNVVFPQFGYRVSLPSSARFMARTETSCEREFFDIRRLEAAEVCSDGSVKLVNGTQLKAVEIIPTYLPYKLSNIEQKIVSAYISIMNADGYCYRSLREGLPEHLQDQVPDIRALDFSRLRTLKPPPLKVICIDIRQKCPELSVSDQKIAAALEKAGARVVESRPRRAMRGICPPTPN
jgi:hypothetical protein